MCDPVVVDPSARPSLPNSTLFVVPDGWAAAGVPLEYARVSGSSVGAGTGEGEQGPPGDDN